MKVTFEIEYNRGDIVYHRLEESVKGIVMDYIYKHSIQEVQYLVCFGIELSQTVWCDGIELSDSPVF